MKNKNVVTFVVGPTAAGKSKWALEEAAKNNGLILNADSVQVYRYLDIGAAKPTAEDRATVQHELYDLVLPDQTFTAGDYRRAALQVIEREIDRHNLYIVGGSGFYIQALDRGMYDVGEVPDDIKNQVEEIAKTSGAAWQKLKELDAKSTEKLSPNDHYRVKRALEITMAEGRPWSEISAEFKEKTERLSDRFKVRKVGIAADRTVLHERIVTRTRRMLEMGLLGEVKRLCDMGYTQARALSSVGYRECCEVLNGHSSEDGLDGRIVTSTMQLAKKQMTWFKRDNEIEWLQ